MYWEQKAKLYSAYLLTIKRAIFQGLFMQKTPSLALYAAKFWIYLNILE